MLFEWEPKYSVKIKEIDNQHKKLFSIVNELHKIINREKSKTNLKKIIEELTQYTIYHFETEEKYFKKFNYKFSDEHIKEHKSFRKKIKDISKKYNHNDIEISFEIIDFLEDWIIEHVTDSDQKYVECFQKHNLK